jgi:hypothetical protein
MAAKAAPWRTIRLSARAFGHLSQGLYRTPAGAIKELISNSFDADSERVRIHTDFPRFMSFSCEDTGTGMARAEFERLVDRGIGDSFKRSAQEVSEKHARPLIGRLGLGILALAQICTEFDIVSHHHKSQCAFKATIKFLPYTREEMDRRAAQAAGSHEPVEGGQFLIEDIPYDATGPSLRIFTVHLRESYQKTMRALDHYGNKIVSSKGTTYEPYPSFSSFLGSIYRSRPSPTRSLTLRSGYDQMVFGLALAPPLEVVAAHDIAIKLPRMQLRQKTLRSFAFNVEVDNLSLRCPVYLPSDSEGTLASECTLGESSRVPFKMEDGTTTEECQVFRRGVNVKNRDLTFNLYDFEYAARVGGRELAFSGYLFQQTQRLFPQDIQGALIRINNVAIGKYDNSMFSYPFAEGPRFSMVTCELFIEKGFEDALNVDRDSFNELHLHYLRVRAYLHSLLHERIFPVTWSEEKARNDERRREKANQQHQQFSRAFRKATGESLGRVKRIKWNDGPSTTELSESPVDFASDTVELQEAHPVLGSLQRKKRVLPIVERIVIAFERANAESGAAKRRELFYRLLLEIFDDA